VDAFDKKMSGIWKAAKGEKVPKDTQKQLDDILKKSTDAMKSKSGAKPKYNADSDHRQWIDILS